MTPLLNRGGEQMKPFFTTLVLTSPVLAIVLYFALQGRDEIKTDQRTAAIERKIDAAKFDRDFSAAWAGEKKLSTPSGDEIVALEKERDALKAQATAGDTELKHDLADLKAALEEVGEGKK